MEVIDNLVRLREKVRTLKVERATTGFVPTMGYLHAGHLSLLDRAKQENDYVILSIFVNPLQFGPGEDLDRYPRDVEGDLQKAAARGCDLVFLPDNSMLYPPGFCTYVNVEGLTDTLCGASRPGHFRGVTTVVSKLFNLVQPTRAYFGQKDAQQALVIRRMAEDLNFELEVIICPTVREADGLAMSSRNAYLSPAERSAATVLYRALREGEKMIRGGERNSSAVKEKIRKEIEGEPLAAIDYVAVVSTRTLRECNPLEGTILIAGAIKIGQTRLIDNIMLIV